MKDGHYVYMDQLEVLDGKKPGPGLQAMLPIISWDVHTPLNLEQWIRELSHHPDTSFANYILDGIHRGFRIGFDRSHSLVSANSNLHCNNPDIVSDYLAREVASHRMWKCPMGVRPKGVHISPLGLIPKKNKPGKWRMIVDLSSPWGSSINDGISSDVASLQYTSIDDLAALVVSEGKGYYLVKANIQEAYRTVPVHPEDQHLLGVEWNGAVFIDKVLPFGLRSAPKIFSAVADALLWILTKKGITKGLHYLDDFVLVAGSREEALRQKQAMLSTFENLQVPIEQSKLEGPDTCLTFLGIEIDTDQLQLRLPHKKLVDLKALLVAYMGHISIPKKEVERLTGLLQFACKVVRPGRPFLRRLYALQEVGSHPRHLVQLNKPARADIIWWHLFVERWNDISLLWDLGLAKNDLKVYSDASGSWGCAAFQHPHWFQLGWNPRLCQLSIAVKELIPVVLAAALFGHQWAGKVVQFVVDNKAVVDVLNATFCSDTHMMHLIRLLVFFAAKYNFWFTAAHIPGKNNVIADALSRNNLSLFRSQAPEADYHPAQLSAALVSLISQIITWTSTSWMKLFKDCTEQAYRQPPIEPIK